MLCVVLEDENGVIVLNCVIETLMWARAWLGAIK